MMKNMTQQNQVTEALSPTLCREPHITLESSALFMTPLLVITQRETKEQESHGVNTSSSQTHTWRIALDSSNTDLKALTKAVESSTVELVGWAHTRPLQVGPACNI